MPNPAPDLLTKMQVDESVIGSTEIDESLYSRQLYVLGHEAMKRMSASNVLIVGLKGLGVEISKNIALAGVKSLTLYDPAPVSIADLSSQFFLRSGDVGKPRDVVTAPRIAELNAYTPVTVHESFSLDQNLEQFDSYQVVVLTGTNLRTQEIVGDYCHKKGIYFIAVDTFGLFGCLFCDFGENFTVLDVTGEPALNGIVAGITDDGLISTLEDVLHGFEDGDYVTFTEVQGMDALNGCEPRKVTVISPYTFSIGDVSGLGKYEGGGLYRQVKMPKKLSFKTMSQSLRDPEFFISDYSKMLRPLQLHVGFQALHAFVQSQKRLPRPMNEADATVLFESAKAFVKTENIDVELEEDLIKELSYQAMGDLNPMAAFFGGFAAQEVLKAVSGKFHPIKQWMYFDSLESLPSSFTRSEETCKPHGSRYDGQIAVFGSEFQSKLANQTQFLVGAGAIGCEMLKNWAMMGLGTGPEGSIIVTDMDSIEKSNLNRQFLFRPHNVGQMKSLCAANAALEMNPDLKNHIEAMQERVGPDTETVFDDDFWTKLDGVTNALDNVEARNYVDRRCIRFLKPLLESGTLGTKGNIQVVLPNLTESYSSTHDPPEESFPMCTLKSFPNKIEHTIAWARDLFESSFVKPAELCNLYLTQPHYLETNRKQDSNEEATLKTIRNYLTTCKPSNFEDCITWARLQFETYFKNEIEQLLFSLPKDTVNEKTKLLFWSGPKRAPDPITFDVNNPTHYGFIIAAANLHAVNYGIDSKGFEDSEIRKVLENVIVPDFTPVAGVKIQTDDKAPPPDQAGLTGQESEQEKRDQLIKQIPTKSSLGDDFTMTVIEFEKDDDTNHHIDFITAASNLRAENYKIEPADRHQTKFVAGKIIPAIATTTALVTGLVMLELVKIVDGKTDIEKYKNGFVNLALPFLGFSDPVASSKMKYTGPNGDVTLDQIWGRFEVNDMTLQELFDDFEGRGLTISMLSSGVSLIYANFFPAQKRKDCLSQKLSKLIDAKTGLLPGQKSAILEIVTEDDDLELPYIVVKLK